jgi:hypothetical protein
MADLTGKTPREHPGCIQEAVPTFDGYLDHPSEAMMEGMVATGQVSCPVARYPKSRGAW